MPSAQGAGANDKNAGLAEPADHALGRSRGGLTTKIHTLTDQVLCPVTVILTAGQAGDTPQLAPLLDAHADSLRATGGAEGFRLLADKAYSHPSTRAHLRRRRIPHTIPERDDQRQRRKARGSKGGRPPAFDPGLYAHRNTVERGFGQLKQWRGIATRYDKYALTFLGGLHLAAAVLHSRNKNLRDMP